MVEKTEKRFSVKELLIMLLICPVFPVVAGALMEYIAITLMPPASSGNSYLYWWDQAQNTRAMGFVTGWSVGLLFYAIRRLSFKNRPAFYKSLFFLPILLFWAGIVLMPQSEVRSVIATPFAFICLALLCFLFLFFLFKKQWHSLLMMFGYILSGILLLVALGFCMNFVYKLYYHQYFLVDKADSGLGGSF